MDRVEAFYARHGAKAILVGRFVGIIRAVSPFLAGSSGLRFRAFLPWSLLGTAVWATAFTLVGYAFSESFSQAAGALTHGAFALALVAGVLLAVRAHRRTRSFELIERLDPDLLRGQQRALDRAAEDPGRAVLVL